jgi:hypothetical protein
MRALTSIKPHEAQTRDFRIPIWRPAISARSIAVKPVSGRARSLSDKPSEMTALTLPVYVQILVPQPMKPKTNAAFKIS